MTADRKWALEYGDSRVSETNEILRTVVGSGVHGVAIEGTDDHDEMAVYVEPEQWVLGVRDRRDNVVLRTQPEGARSGPGDTDLVAYSLRKYLRLAVKGNPTALIPLFAPAESVLNTTRYGDQLRSMAVLFLSQQAGWRFLGYARSQHERMMGGGRQGRVPNRPELIEKYGWDTKYGSHALRLAIQGLELVRDRRITLPMKEGDRALVLAVKQGELSQDEASSRILALLDVVQNRLYGHALPQEADLDTIEEWAVWVQQSMWGHL